MQKALPLMMMMMHKQTRAVVPPEILAFDVELDTILPVDEIDEAGAVEEVCATETIIVDKVD